ncbi:hypothetical protein FB446DRAFT_847223 [Lentinula raphanica]|nr:hypothetical protein FB446DRAFT_847223 [Lentinula raphanica]
MPPSPPSIIGVYTPIFVGMLLDVFLYGIVVAQIYTYYRISKSDKLWIKLFVLYLLVAETINSISDIGLIFEPFLLKSDDPNSTLNTPWTLRFDGISTTIISTPVQIFMAWRIHVIMGTVIPAAGILLLSLSSLAGSIWLQFAIQKTPQLAKLDDIHGAPSLWLISSAVADVVISCCLVYGLTKRRSRFSFMKAQIDRIIRVTVQTGSLTTLATLADNIVFLSVSNTTIFLAWDLTVSKLYTSTLLSSLNARRSSRDAEAKNSNEPNALFSNDFTSSELTKVANSWSSRHNSQQVLRISQDNSENQCEQSSYPLNPLRRVRDRLKIRETTVTSAPREFNILVSQTTVTDNEAVEAIYPPPKIYN